MPKKAPIPLKMKTWPYNPVPWDTWYFRQMDPPLLLYPGCFFCRTHTTSSNSCYLTAARPLTLRGHAARGARMQLDLVGMLEMVSLIWRDNEEIVNCVLPKQKLSAMQRTFSSGGVTIVDLENKFRVTHFLFKNYNSQAALPFTDVIASQMKLLLYQGHVVKSLPKWLRLHIYMEVELQWAMELDSTLELDIIHQTMCNMQVVPDKKHLTETSGFGPVRPFWTILER